MTSDGRFADSAGVPWAGRSFESNEFANDDGKAPEHLMAAISDFREDRATAVEVIDAFRSSRLLIPLLASLGEGGEGAHGMQTDKSADLSIVTVEGPDGYEVLPVFSSVSAMNAWHPEARPVPSDAIRVALAAASEKTTRVVLDAGSPSEFAIRRPAIEAIAQQQPWVEVQNNTDVAEAFEAALGSVAEVVDFSLEAGDPSFLLRAAELLVTIKLVAGLDAEALQQVIKRVGEAIAASEVIVNQVDSLRLKLAQ